MRKFLSALLGGGSDSVSLAKDRSGKPLTLELQTAVTALLVEIASADREIAEREAQVICILLSKHLQISDSAVADLVDAAVTAWQAAGTIDPFAAQLRERLNEKQRTMLLALVWKMVHADGTVADFEKRRANELKFKLGLSNDQAQAARKQAEKFAEQEKSK